MKILSKEQIVLLHGQLLAQTGGTAGVRDEGLLESALAVPFQEFCGVSNYPTVKQKAVRLAYGIIKNHPFVDGNKRVGAHILLVTLCLNGIELEYEQKELVDVILDVASGKADVDDLLLWVLEHEVYK